jgi:hypothetical protein
MSTISYLQCMHGMIWKTCNLCKDKTEEQVSEELRYVSEDFTTKLNYDYQDLEQPPVKEIDLDYDFDDANG